MANFICPQCQAQFLYALEYQAHLRDTHSSCYICREHNADHEQLLHHIELCEQSRCFAHYECGFCNRIFAQQSTRDRHAAVCRLAYETELQGRGAQAASSSSSSSRGRPEPTQSAFQGAAARFDVPVSAPHSADITLADMYQDLITMITAQVNEMYGIKWSVALSLTMIRSLGEETQTLYVNSGKYITMRQNFTDLENKIKQCTLDLLDEIDKLALTGSGWIFVSVDGIQLDTVLYKPFSSFRAGSFIPLPAFLASPRKRIVNINAPNEMCLIYCICAAEFGKGKHHPARVGHYKNLIGRYNTTGIQYPTPISYLNRFERQNKHISVNVYAVSEETKEIYPCRVTKLLRKTHVDLLLLTGPNGQHHFCLIRDLNTLLAKTHNRHLKKKFICHLCLTFFTTEKKMADHRVHCKKFKGQKVSFPELGSVVEFKEYHTLDPLPFFIVADFETVNCPLLTCEPPPGTASVHRTHYMRASMFAYVIINEKGERVKGPVSFSKECEDDNIDVAATFIQKMLHEYDNLKIFENANHNVPMQMDEQAKSRHDSASICGFCNRPFEPGDVRCRDHCHIDGRYRRAAHRKCNIEAGKRRNILPIFLHNFSKFDCRLLVRSLPLLNYKGNITALAKTRENYFYLQLGHKLRFMDSCLFMPASLASLVENLEVEKQPLFQSMYPNAQLRQLCAQKLSFCHDYIVDFETYTQRYLPPKECFYSRLSREVVSDEAYETAQEVWRLFKCENIGDFSKRYCELDTNLLACTLQAFRDFCRKLHKLDVLQYLTLGHFSWNCALYHCKTKLQLVTCPTINDIFEQLLKGGFCGITEKLAQSNVPGTPGYDPEQEERHLLSLDCRNLYGYALSKALPSGDFVFLSDSEVAQMQEDNFSVLQKLTLDSTVGYVLVCDLKFEDSLHDLFDSYPPAPVSTVIHENMVGPFMRKLMESVGRSARGNEASTRLTASLYDRMSYPCYGLLLALYLRIGVKVTKVHKILKFSQQYVFRDYVRKNSEIRSQTENAFFKKMLKNLNNILYGKSVESVRNRINVQFFQEKDKFVKFASSAAYQGCTILAENFVIGSAKKINILLNKPSYMGAVVTEIARYQNYLFLYEYVYKIFTPLEVKTICYDTDSHLLYFRGVSDLYVRLALIKDEILDTSMFPKSHLMYSEKNKMVPGMFADETDGQECSLFIGLAPKLYYLERGNQKDGKKVAKGVPRICIEKDLNKELYLDVIHNLKVMSVSFSEIATDGQHNLFLQTRKKTALSAVDIKRFTLPCGLKTLAFGHCKIREQWPEDYAHYLKLQAEKDAVNKAETDVILGEGDDGPESDV